MRTLTFVAALAALCSTAAAAQRRPQPTPAPQAAPAPRAAPRDSASRGPMGRGMEPGGLAAWLAANPAELNLTPDQLTRIRAARDQVVSDDAPLRQQLQAAFANRDWRSMTPADRRALMDSTRTAREQLRANAERARTTVLGVLTPEQQQTFDRTHPRWRTGGPAQGPRGGAGRGGMMLRRGAGTGTRPAAWMRPGRPMARAMPLRWAMGPRLRAGYRMGWPMGMRAGRRAGWPMRMRAARRAPWRAWRPWRGI